MERNEGQIKAARGMNVSVSHWHTLSRVEVALKGQIGQNITITTSRSVFLLNRN